MGSGQIDGRSPGQATRRRSVTLLGAAALLLAGVPAKAEPALHRVSIKALTYQPAELTIKRSDVVIWTNDDPYPHTVTAKDVFDSGSIAPGASWRYTAGDAGDFAYTCTFHPNMKGSLRVE